MVCERNRGGGGYSGRGDAMLIHHRIGYIALIG